MSDLRTPGQNALLSGDPAFDLNRPYHSSTGAATIGTSPSGSQLITPQTRYESRDPLKGTDLERFAIFGLDPLGIFDVPQITLDIERLNPEQLAQLTEQQARRSWMASLGLEREFSPETEALRREAVTGLLGDVRGGGQVMDPMVRQQLMQTMMAQGQMGDVPYEQLPQNEMYDMLRQQVMADLQLGGQLDRETQNLVGRASAQRAGAGGFLGGQVGRDISARDLGLTSMQVAQQRRGAAGALAQQEMAQAAQQQGFKASLNQINQQLAGQRAGTQLQFGTMLTGADQQAFTNRAALAQFGQGIERPMGSIDPGALASAYIADINQRNQLVNQAAIAQANVEAQAKESQNALIGDVFGGVMGMFGGCWVARAVYGDSNPSWELFSNWLRCYAPKWVGQLYLKHGPQFGAWLNSQQNMLGNMVRRVLRSAMNRAIRHAALKTEVVWQ